MLQSLYSAISALQAHQQLLGVVSNNLANINTTGYKASRTLFQDTLSQTLKAPTQGTATTAGTNGIQIGLGVSLSTVTPRFDQGALQSTGVPTDLAIEGQGFLTVNDPATGQSSYTRVGALALDSNNYLVDANGYRVQGVQVPPAQLFNGQYGDVNPVYTPTDGQALGDLQITNTWAPNPDPVQPLRNSPAVSFSIEASGRVLMQLESGVTLPVGYIAENRFQDPQALLRSGKNDFVETPAAGRVFTGYKAPGNGGLGNLRAGYLEMSNVDMGQEFTDMIRAQRGLQANSRVITTSDEVLQDLIQLKR